jgi:hypothetical protein
VPLCVVKRPIGGSEQLLRIGFILRREGKPHLGAEWQKIAVPGHRAEKVADKRTAASVSGRELTGGSNTANSSPPVRETRGACGNALRSRSPKATRHASPAATTQLSLGGAILRP